jgi:hypothetical protein
MAYLGLIKFFFRFNFFLLIFYTSHLLADEKKPSLLPSFGNAAKFYHFESVPGQTLTIELHAADIFPNNTDKINYKLIRASDYLPSSQNGSKQEVNFVYLKASFFSPCSNNPRGSLVEVINIPVDNKKMTHLHIITEGDLSIFKL